MNVSILAVGTELLMGKTVNTNATYLSKEVNALGHRVLYHLTVGDNPTRLAETLDYLFQGSDIVITTGGLGPTQDDLTKEVIAEYLNKPLIRDEEAYMQILERFKAFNVVMTSNNAKQALLPKDAIPMYNEKGTAPGFIMASEGKYIIVLPGPPHEMTHMFRKSVTPFLKSLSEGHMVSEYINLFGIGESSAESLIEDLVSTQTNPTIAMYANIGQVSIRVTAFAETQEKAEKILLPTLNALKERLNSYIIGYGEHDLRDVTLELLLKNKLTLSLAESCTGGLIASNIMAVPGVSNIFDSGYVTYSNSSKERILKVSEETLNTYGAVSEETCREMVNGLSDLTQSDVCLSVTGIAGPAGGTAEKPVGLVFIGIQFKGETTVKKHLFTGDRSVIRLRTYLSAMNLIRESIIDSCN